jgi:hypothetical protein
VWVNIITFIFFVEKWQNICIFQKKVVILRVIFRAYTLLVGIGVVFDKRIYYKNIRNNEKDLLFISGNDLCSLCSSANEGGWYRIG